mgnify:CR=1 FL=1
MEYKYIPTREISIYEVTNAPTIIYSIKNEMTTPTSFHDVTTPEENFAEFIITDFLQTAIFAKLTVHSSGT